MNTLVVASTTVFLRELGYSYVQFSSTVRDHKREDNTANFGTQRQQTYVDTFLSPKQALFLSPGALVRLWPRAVKLMALSCYRLHNRIRKIESAGKNSGAAAEIFMGFCIPRLALSKKIPLAHTSVLGLEAL